MFWPSSRRWSKRSTTVTCQPDPASSEATAGPAMLAPETRTVGLLTDLSVDPVAGRCRVERGARAVCRRGSHNRAVIASEPVALHVVEAGDPAGVPLVVLHGVGNGHRTFGFLVDAVPGRFRLLRVDLRGHGASPRTPGRYALDDYVADVLALLEDTGPAVLVGHSLGGMVAWALARRRPDLVRAALLEDPPLGSSRGLVPRLEYFRDLAVLAGRWQAERVDPLALAAQLAELPAGPRRETAGELLSADGIEARARALLEIDPGVLDAVADGTTAATDDPPVGPLPPVRVLAADETCGGVLPVAVGEALVREHPEVSLRRLDGAGHGIHDEVAHRPTWLAELDALLTEVHREV